jgi:LPS-assembly protein
MVKQTLSLFACFFICTAAYAARNSAIDPNTKQGPQPFKVAEQDVNAPAAFKADSLHYDPTTQQVFAEGHVEVSQDKRILFADKVTYYQATDVVEASGNVVVMEPNGQAYFADNVVLNKQLKRGVVKNIKAILADKSRLAAGTAMHLNENVTKFRNVVYSPCKPCKNNPNKAPLWQLKAKKVKMDEEKQSLTYQNAVMELYGVPVFYTPYFSHPTPNADNKSGFLIPTYRNSTVFGTTFQTPYYLSIAPNMDLTFAPIFTEKEGVVMAGEFRHLMENGDYKLKASITNPTKRDNTGQQIEGNEIRGHLEGEGKFDLKDDWAWGFSGKRATDDTYLSRYRFGNETTLTSTAYINQIKNRDFIEIRALTFQGLKAGDNPDTTPLILPLTNTHFESAPGYLGSKLALDTNTNVLFRETGAQSRRASMTGSYHLPIITPSGNLIELGAQLRGDIYSVEDVGYDGQENTPGRLIPELNAEWSYPLMRRLGEGNLIVSPIVTGAISPYGGNPKSIPNEDSQNFELNDLNVFSSNKFTGLDRVEDGPRTSYGVRSNYNTDSNKSLGILLAESYRMRDDRQNNEAGLEPGASSYVGRIDMSDNRYIDLTYNFRISKRNGNFERSEISNTLYLNPINLSVDYIFLDDEFRTLGGDREEISGSASYQIAPAWTAVGNLRRGLAQSEQNGGLISSGLGLLFRNECFGFSLILNREYTRDRDIPPSTSVTFQVALKNLSYK